MVPFRRLLPVLCSIVTLSLGCHGATRPAPAVKPRIEPAETTPTPSATDTPAQFDFAKWRGKPLPKQLDGCRSKLVRFPLGRDTSAALCDDFRPSAIGGSAMLLVGLEKDLVFTGALTWKTGAASEDAADEWKAHGDAYAGALAKQGCQPVDAACFSKVGCSNRTRWRLRCDDVDVFGVLDVRRFANYRLSSTDAPAGYLGWVYAPLSPSAAQQDFAGVAAFLNAEGIDSLYPLALATSEHAQGEGLPRPPEGDGPRFRAFHFPPLTQADARRLCTDSGAELAAPKTKQELAALRDALPRVHQASWISGGRCSPAETKDTFCWDDASAVSLPFESGVWVQNGMAAPPGRASLFLTNEGLVSANPVFAKGGVTGFVCAWP